MAAEQAGASVADVLRNTDLVIYGTTHATNAIIERNTARTAFLVTEGFPDILVLREGGKLDPFNLSYPPIEPYVPRRTDLRDSRADRFRGQGGRRA